MATKKATKGQGGSSLTPKQEMFCQLYVLTGNATWAYKQAYDCGRMKYKTVKAEASRLVHRGNTAARIGELQAVRDERLNAKYGKKLIVERCMETLESNAQDMYDIDPESGEEFVRRITDLDRRTASSIRQITPGRYGTTVRFESKMKAAEVLARILGLNAPLVIDGRADGDIEVTIK